jgi:hypothetical protein
VLPKPNCQIPHYSEELPTEVFLVACLLGSSLLVGILELPKLGALVEEG